LKFIGAVYFAIAALLNVILTSWLVDLITATGQAEIYTGHWPGSNLKTAVWNLTYK
jgi:hypothetical protein